MSTIRVPIVPITEIRAHSDPEVEKLEVAIVEGWQLCVPKGQYKVGDRVVYFEQGTVLPYGWAQHFGVTQYLSEKTDINGDKVLVIHRVRLRGEPSFGLAVSVPDNHTSDPDGTDLADYYGATKFMPPMKTQVTDAEIDHPLFQKYTDIENLRSFPHIFEAGEDIVMTEKIHGTNCRFGFVMDDGDMLWVAGSRALRRKCPVPPDSTFEQWITACVSNVYWFPWTIKAVRDLMETLQEQGHVQATIYGEVYGSKVQSYDYGERALGFRAFDIMVDGEYLPYHRFINLCNLYHIDAVPLLYSGPFDIDAIAARSNGSSLLGGTHGREGGVVRPRTTECWSAQIGRVVLKYVGDDYLFSKTAMKHDTTDA